MPRQVSVFLLSMLIAVLPLAGCWDYRPMAKRAYVIGASIDSTDMEQSAEKPPSQTETTKFLVTFVLPNFASGGEGKSSSEKHIPIVVQSGSMFGAFRRLALHAPWEPFFEHMKVIVISEAVLRNGVRLDDILDSFERQQQMRRDIVVYVTPESAQKILLTEFPGPAATPDILEGLFKDKSLGFSAGRDALGDLAAIIHQGGDVIVPIVYPQQKAVAVGGAAVFRSGYLVGKIDERQTRSLRLLRGSIKETAFRIPCQSNSERVIILESEGIKTKITWTGDTVSSAAVVISIDISSQIAENQCREERSSSQSEFGYIEQAVKAQLEQDLISMMRIMSDWDVDLIGFKRFMHIQKPNLYRQFQKTGVKIGAAIPYTIKITTKVKSTGLIRD